MSDKLLGFLPVDHFQDFLAGSFLNQRSREVEVLDDGKVLDETSEGTVVKP